MTSTIEQIKHIQTLQPHYLNFLYKDDFIQDMNRKRFISHDLLLAKIYSTLTI